MSLAALTRWQKALAYGSLAAVLLCTALGLLAIGWLLTHP